MFLFYITPTNDIFKVYMIIEETVRSYGASRIIVATDNLTDRG